MRRRLSFATMCPPAPAPSCPTAHFFELKVGLYTTCIFFVARGHLGAVFVYHVCLEVQKRPEDHEFACETLRLVTWMVRVREVLFLRDV